MEVFVTHIGARELIHSPALDMREVHSPANIRVPYSYVHGSGNLQANITTGMGCAALVSPGLVGTNNFISAFTADVNGNRVLWSSPEGMGTSTNTLEQQTVTSLPACLTVFDPAFPSPTCLPMGMECLRWEALSLASPPSWCGRPQLETCGPTTCPMTA